MPRNRVVPETEWLAARMKLLAKEKELTRLRDELSRERRALPWVKVERPYTFETPQGRQSLADLFDGRSQLIAYHFMFGPGWKEGCVGCSFLADNVDSARMHFEQNDLSFVAVSRAPLAELEAFRQRMGWRFRWVSSADSAFNYDYHVSFRKEELATGKVLYNYEPREMNMEELPGLSVFYKDEHGELFHTYSSYARGPEMMLNAYNFLDLAPKGRNENGPHHNLGDWVRHHDRYDHGGHRLARVDSNGQFVAPKDCCDP